MAVVDLEQSEEISSVTTRTCVATGDWVFDARGMSVEVSENGTDFTTVASEDYPAMAMSSNSIYTHSLTFDPVKARYVKVTVKPEMAMPEWHGGAGRPGFVFVDEIEIN